MWPFDSANTDSDWASRSRSRAVSWMCHGSTGYALSEITGQLLQVADHAVGAVLAQGLRLADAVDPHDVAKGAGPAGLDAGQGVLEDRGLARLDGEQLGAVQEGVRRGLAGQVPFADRHAVHPLLHVLPQTGDLQDVGSVGARRHHRRGEPRG